MNYLILLILVIHHSFISIAISNYSNIIKQQSANNVNYNFSKIVVIHDLRKDPISLGLTNQLARVVQLIEYGCRYNAYISVKSFRLDFANDIFGNLEDVLDIEKTNQNINCTKIIKSVDLHQFRGKHIYITGPQLNKAVEFKYMLFLSNYSRYHNLEFSHSTDTTWQSSENNIKLPTKYNAIHLRIEMDMLLAYFTHDKSRKVTGDNTKVWREAHRNRLYDKAIEYEIAEIRKDINSSMVLCIIESHINHVKHHFTDKSIPIVIVTSLGKNDPTNHNVEWILGYFRYQMIALGYSTLIGKATSKYRELNAVADTKIMREAEQCIGTVTSTFSYMANSLRKNNNENYKAPCLLIGGNTFGIFEGCSKANNIYHH